MSTLGLACLALPVVACVPTYQVQRSVRAPHAAVPLRTGQPLTTPVELTVGASNALDVVKPKLGTSRDAVEVPQHQMRGELRFRHAERGELALIHERGIGGTSLKLSPTQAPVGEGSPHGTGGALRYSFPASPAISIGIEGELISWSLPYVEYRTCTRICDEAPLTTVDHGTANELTAGLGVTPSYQHGKLTLYGGVFARNHPTVVRKGTEYGSQDEDVSGGPLNVMVHAGAAYRVDPRVSALVQIHQNLTADPVRYGPGVGLGLSIAMF